ncbi:MAG: TetR/AcrR family transcriptional regulator [Candidatus Paceibacterota bacterium]
MQNDLSKRQEEIIKASLELIAEKGIQGFTIKNLSKKIVLVESAIYRHYESKTHILIAILDNIGSYMPPLKNKENLSVLEILEYKVKNHFTAFTEFPALVSVVFSEEIFQNEKLLIDRTNKKIQSSIFEMTTLIEKGQKNGEIRNDIEPEHFAVMIAGTIRLFVKQWKMAGYSFDLVKKGNQLIKSLKLILKP